MHEEHFNRTNRGIQALRDHSPLLKFPDPVQFSQALFDFLDAILTKAYETYREATYHYSRLLPEHQERQTDQDDKGEALDTKITRKINFATDRVVKLGLLLRKF